MVNEEQRARLIVKLQRECGELMVQALKHPEVIEVMLNPDGNLWIDKFGDGMLKIGSIPAAQSETLISTTAAIMGTIVSHESPILEGEFPLDGSRFEGIIAPVVAKPTFAIRKKAVKVFSDLICIFTYNGNFSRWRSFLAIERTPIGYPLYILKHDFAHF